MGKVQYGSCHVRGIDGSDQLPTHTQDSFSYSEKFSLDLSSITSGTEVSGPGRHQTDMRLNLTQIQGMSVFLEHYRSSPHKFHCLGLYTLTDLIPIPPKLFVDV